RVRCVLAVWCAVGRGRLGAGRLPVGHRDCAGLRAAVRRGAAGRGAVRAARDRGLSGPRGEPRERSGMMLLPTAVVGSHGLPGWGWLGREAREAGRMGATDVRELMEDATQVALLDQERAGVDVVSTGEMMRVRFIIGFYDRFSGIRTLPAARRLGQPLWDTNTPFEVFDRISAPEGLGIVEEFKLARSLTSWRIKATVPGPHTLLVPLKLGGGYRDKDTLLADLVGIVNAECRALVEAGADFIQIDEPHSGMYSGAPPRFDEGVNRVVEGIEAKIAVHVCFGNLYGRPFSAVRAFKNLYPALRSLRPSQAVLEFRNR